MNDSKPAAAAELNSAEPNSVELNSAELNSAGLNSAEQKPAVPKPPSKKKVTPVQIIIYVFLVLICVTYILPLLWVFNVSFKTNKEIFTAPFALPENITIDNYTFAWSAGHLGIATLNSLIVCVVALVLSTIIGSMAAFGIARLCWRGAKLAMTYFLTGMMIPVHCVLIPLFTRFAQMGLSNTLTGLILPYITFSLPITIFIMTGFFTGLPNELIECACMEGANIFEIFFQICLPLSRTGLFVTGLMTFIGTGTSFFLQWYSSRTITRRLCRYRCQSL